MKYIPPKGRMFELLRKNVMYFYVPKTTDSFINQKEAFPYNQCQLYLCYCYIGFLKPKRATKFV